MCNTFFLTLKSQAPGVSANIVSGGGEGEGKYTHQRELAISALFLHLDLKKYVKGLQGHKSWTPLGGRPVDIRDLKSFEAFLTLSCTGCAGARGQFDIHFFNKF